MKENLVLLSGWARDKKSYKKFIEGAPANWRVFVPSYGELKPYKGIDYFRERLLNFLARNKLAKVSLLGHSLGGALAIHFTAIYPEKINRLFLVDIKGAHKAKSLFYDIFSMYKENNRKGFIAVIQKIARISKNPVLNFRLGLLANAINIQKEARKIKIKSSIFWGENDILAPVSQAKKLRQLIPNSKLFVLKGMGHSWIFDNHEHFWENVAD